jgi:hypothetical protein
MDGWANGPTNGRGGDVPLTDDQGRLGRGSLRMRFETVASLSAIVVGVAAVAVAWFEAQNSRDIRNATVMPVLQAGLSVNTSAEEISIGFVTGNTGPGVGMVHRVIFLAEGRRIESLADLRAELPPELDPAQAEYYTDAIETRAIGSGEGLAPLRLTWQRTPERSRASAAIFRGLTEGAFMEMRLCYCSVYDLCWETRDRSFPVPVDACGPPAGGVNAILKDLPVFDGGE